MYTEEDLGKLGLNVGNETDEDNNEKSLEWLLDMDLSEPKEELFTVADNEYQDAGLSNYEAEVAARPLVRGNGQGDDLANYVYEEIVMASEDTVGDIYAGSDDADSDDSGGVRNEGLMAIDYSADARVFDNKAVRGVEKGADILGLADDDDMGEKSFAIKRVKRPRPVTADDTAAQTPADTQQPNTLSDAPVPTQVAEPDVDKGANDAGADSLQEYLANTPEPADDEAFDAYLLAGEHLSDSGADPEELVLEQPGDVQETGAADDGGIDYHVDFLSLEGFPESASSAIAPVIGTVMDEISAAVAARLEALGENAGAVTVDVRIGADEASVKQCQVDGFEPVRAVCPDLPQALRSLEQEARDAIYVRLQHTVSNETWNGLFGEDFAAGREGAAGEEQSADPATAKPVAGADWSQDDGFGEDIFGDDFSEEFSAQLDAKTGAEDVDIEEAFSGLEQGAEADTDAGEQSGFAQQPESDVEEQQVAAATVAEPVVADAEPEPVVEGEVSKPAVAKEELAPVVEKKVSEPVAADAEPEPEPEPKIVAEEAEAREAPVAAIDNAYPDNFIPDYIEFNYTSQSNAEIFADFLDAFIEEGSVEVEKLEQEVGEWEKAIADESLLANVSRTLHTIKGIAKGVGLQRLGTLVHNFETLLDKMPKPAASQQQDYFHVVNAWLDAVVRGFECVSESRADIDSELPVHPEQAKAGVEKEEEAPEAKSNASTRRNTGAKTVREQEAKEPPAPGLEKGKVEPPRFKQAARSALDKKRDKQLADEGAKVLAAQQSVRITSEKLDHLLNLTSQVQQLGVRASQNTSRSKRSSAELQARLSSVRTHIRKIADRALLNVNAQPGKSAPDLDALEMDQYSELQEAANILREGVEDLADLVDDLTRQNIQVEALLKQQSSVISSISSSIQGARVVPVSRLMPGLRRIVRTVSTDLGKVVSFQVLNETGALDRDHYARLQVILEHMVRNALDHGIESPEERVAVGKPTGGRITVDVRKSGGDYMIRLADDGRGIDPDAIRQKALEKDLDLDVDELSDDEAVRLIFHKGFSTASSLSEISGRGVGMDIVLTELQQLGGDVEIQSAVGLGTAFEVRIPSNFSVNGALLVAAGGEPYAIPLNGLIGIEQVPVDEFFAAVEKHEKLTLSGMGCEATYLATLCQGLPLPDRSLWHSFVPVIIAGSEERYMAIAIDNVEEALELVVRSLGTQFSSVPGVAGAATTAEGEAIVALDLNLMVMSAGEDGIAPVAVSQMQADAPLAMVVDDSRTQRMVATRQLESVGMETITAENGMVAIDLLNATHRLPDVILLDVEMPVKDGIETLREIRKSRRYGDLPVIMVTSRTGAKHRALASEAGCNAYMGKPFNFAALTKQINELTGLELVVS